jgi:hypothetical protein
MCDYSLAGFPNRLAVEGEQLFVHRFVTGAIGLVSAIPGWKNILAPSRTPAVCIPPGARLRLHDIPPELQHRLGVGDVESVSFVQQSAEAFMYRDAVQFGNGKELLLQALRCGQRVDVLSLSGGEQEIKAVKEKQEYSADFLLEETAYGHFGAIPRWSRPSD